MGTLVNGIKEIFATSQSTATHVPVCASDGTPQGRISVGDLASVLGGIKPNGHIQSGDADNYSTTGAFSLNVPDYESAHLPCRYGVLIVVKVGNNTGNTTIQLVCESASDNVYFRLKSNTWSSWSLVANFPQFYKNYVDLSALSAAVVNNQKILKGRFENVTVQSQRQIAGTARGGLLIVADTSSGRVESIDIKYHLAFSAVSVLGGSADIRRDEAGANILIRNIGTATNIFSYTYIDASM